VTPGCSLTIGLARSLSTHLASASSGRRLRARPSLGWAEGAFDETPGEASETVRCTTPEARIDSGAGAGRGQPRHEMGARRSSGARAAPSLNTTLPRVPWVLGSILASARAAEGSEFGALPFGARGSAGASAIGQPVWAPSANGAGGPGRARRVRAGALRSKLAGVNDVAIRLRPVQARTLRGHEREPSAEDGALISGSGSR